MWRVYHFMFVVAAIQLVSTFSLSKINSYRAENDSHPNLTLGQRVDGDGLLDHAEIKNSTGVQLLSVAKYKYPRSTQLTYLADTANGENITYIQVVDLVEGRVFPQAVITSGGVGQDHVTIEFWAVLDGKIDSTVTLYGTSS